VQRLQGRDRLRGDCLAAHADRDTSPHFELARVLVRLDHVARGSENANDCVM
jgi:hypothetical protein